MDRDKAGGICMDSGFMRKENWKWLGELKSNPLAPPPHTQYQGLNSCYASAIAPEYSLSSFPRSLSSSTAPHGFFCNIYSFMHLLRWCESNLGNCTWNQVVATALYSHLLVFQDNLTRTAQAVLSTKSSCLCLSSARITVMHCHAASHSALQPCPLWQSPLSNPFQLSEGMHSKPLFYLSPPT